MSHESLGATMIVIALVGGGAVVAGPTTWVGWLNFLVLQWLGVRLVRWGNAPDVMPRCLEMFPTCPTCSSPRHLGLAWPVLPLSGWWTRYVPRAPRPMRRRGMGGCA